VRFSRTLAVGVIVYLAAATPAAADSTRYGARYAGESAFVIALPGQSARFVAVFLNTGTATWEPGVVGLLACDEAGTSCGETANDSYAKDWYSDGVYATLGAPVAPGALGFFSYQVVVPPGTMPGTTARFSGAIGLIAAETSFGGEGYYHEVTVPEPGVAARLTVSGNNSPRVAGDRASISVDVDDVNVELVGDDNTTVIAASLDPATCSGAPGGPAQVESVTRTAESGRAWFTVMSLGVYPACRLTVAAAGLLGSTTTIAFEPGQPAGIRCEFSPAAILNDPAAQSIATLSVVDAYGNAARVADRSLVAFERTSGDATLITTQAVLLAGPVSVAVVVRAQAPGVDEYTASLYQSAIAEGTTARCSVRVTDHQ
jgi:hypothetical protein